jgi:hypothetical protein
VIANHPLYQDLENTDQLEYFIINNFTVNEIKKYYQAIKCILALGISEESVSRVHANFTPNQLYRGKLVIENLIISLENEISMNLNYRNLDVDLQSPIYKAPQQRTAIQELANDTSASLDILLTVQSMPINDCANILDSQASIVVDLLDSILNSNSIEYLYQGEQLSKMIPELVPCATKSLHYMKDKNLRAYMMKDPTNI